MGTHAYTEEHTHTPLNANRKANTRKWIFFKWFPQSSFSQFFKYIAKWTFIFIKYKVSSLISRYGFVLICRKVYTHHIKNQNGDEPWLVFGVKSVKYFTHSPLKAAAEFRAGNSMETISAATRVTDMPESICAQRTIVSDRNTVNEDQSRNDKGTAKKKKKSGIRRFFSSFARLIGNVHVRFMPWENDENNLS